MTRLVELNAKIDAFFTRVETRHGTDMQCGTGCSDCCHARLTVTGVEAAALRAEIESWPDPQRVALVGNATTAPPDRCAALDPSGRCLVYLARPLVCRSHGAPIRMRIDSLPVVQSCYRNFLHTTPDLDCVIDQETLSTLSLAVDRAEGGDGTRIDLATLLGTM